MITTRGFRDVIEAGTEQRYDIYDLFLSYPEPLVPRDRRLEVTERIDRDGQVVTPLAEPEIRAAARALKTAGVEAVAICFLNAYRDDRHERAAAAIVAAELPGVPVSISSAVVPEMGEYARFVTTCANAYVQPLMATYLARLDATLRQEGFRGTLRLMHSAGGLIALEAAQLFPIRLLESGPAGGALAAALLGARAGHRDLLAFDMGGTTAKSCLIENGVAQIAPMLEAGREHRFKKGSGLPIKAATIDMIEIGAGGGSIAAIDAVGLLRVGPHSAGAAPGPACYARGGTAPTVTDANLVLGYYDPAFFLGGTMSLDLAAARRAIETVATPLGLSIEQAAWGIHKVVVESMADSARVYLVERGKDPRRYAMVGFGGAGPAHAGEVARALGMTELVVPPASGAASALGFLAAPLSASRVRSLPMRLGTGIGPRAGGTRTTGDGSRCPRRTDRRGRRGGHDRRAIGGHAIAGPNARDRGAAAHHTPGHDRPVGAADQLREPLHQPLRRPAAKCDGGDRQPPRERDRAGPIPDHRRPDRHRKRRAQGPPRRLVRGRLGRHPGL